MITLTKDNHVMAARDGNQLAAFLKAGWLPIEEEYETALKETGLSESQREEVAESTNYTKTDINRMSVQELREMAKRTGVEGAESMTGGELKKYFINVFGL
jgi:hypothetical protein